MKEDGGGERESAVIRRMICNALALLGHKVWPLHAVIGGQCYCAWLCGNYITPWWRPVNTHGTAIPYQNLPDLPRTGTNPFFILVFVAIPWARWVSYEGTHS